MTMYSLQHLGKLPLEPLQMIRSTKNLVWVEKKVIRIYSQNFMKMAPVVLILEVQSHYQGYDFIALSIA